MLSLAGMRPEQVISTVLGALQAPMLRRVYEDSVRRLMRGAPVESAKSGGPTHYAPAITLPPSDAADAQRLLADYQEWLNAEIGSNSDYILRSDLNLLRATEVDVAAFILMKRQDVTAELHTDFYCRELALLLLDQDRLLAELAERDTHVNMASVRRYWRGAPLTLGLEEEYQIVSTTSWELVNGADQILEGLREKESGVWSREFYQSQVEYSSKIHDSIPDLDVDLSAARRTLHGHVPAGLAIASAGTHPFSGWSLQRVSDSSRNTLFLHDLQELVRRLTIFGMHVHVGLEDRELAVETLNASRAYLPLFLALSCSSPFWERRLTGMMSYRSTVFAVLPRTGVPPHFENHHELSDYINLLTETRSFDSSGTSDPTKLWWDVRLHPKIPTIEFRIADACTTVADSLCIAAMCQALVAKLVKLRHSGLRMPLQDKRIIDLNKWRAARYGCDARFIDPAGRREVSVRYLTLQFLDFVDDVLDDLGAREHINHVHRLLDGGSSAKSQIECYETTGCLESVVEHVASRFLAGLAE